MHPHHMVFVYIVSAQALVFQQRAVMMSERVLGIDHPNTITEYSHFALYCFANAQIPTALKIMYRARYLALLCHGENHPDVALYDVSTFRLSISSFDSGTFCYDFMLV